MTGRNWVAGGFLTLCLIYGDLRFLLCGDGGAGALANTTESLRNMRSVALRSANTFGPVDTVGFISTRDDSDGGVLRAQIQYFLLPTKLVAEDRADFLICHINDAAKLPVLLHERRLDIIADAGNNFVILRHKPR